MISINQVLKIHQSAIELFGGANGIRDMGALESALARPFQTYAGIDLYPTFVEKAAAVLESVLINHPFIDGNKRTGYILMDTILRYGNLYIHLTDKEILPFVLAVSTGEKRFDDIVQWLTENTVTQK